MTDTDSIKKNKKDAISQLLSFVTTEKWAPYVFVIFAGVSAYLFYAIYGGDYDCMLHTTIGGYIFKHHSIFKEDIYSWVAKENGWQEIAHSWLGSMIIYFFSMLPFSFEKNMGIYCVVSAMLNETLVHRLFFRKNVSWIEFPIAFMIGDICFNPRPQCLSFLLFFLMMYILYRTSQDSNFKGWILLPVVSLAWANIHGGAIVMLFAFEGLFLAFGLCPNFDTDHFRIYRSFTSFSRSFISLKDFLLELKKYSGRVFWKKIWQVLKSDYSLLTRKMLYALIGSILCGCVNPYGYKIYYYFVITSSAAKKQYISEWQPASLNNYLAIIILFILFVSFASKYYKVNLLQILPIFCCLILGARRVRVLIYGFIYCVPLVADYFIFRKNRLESNFKENSKRCPYFLILIGTVVLLLICIFNPSIQLNEKVMTEEQYNYLSNAGYERIYNSHNFGAKMMYSGISEFTDSRSDLFSEECYVQALEFEHSNDQTDSFKDDFINQYNFDGVLLLTTCHSTINYMEHRDDFIEDYRDDDIVVFRRTGTE